MIPNCINVAGAPFGLLPPGIYNATMEEVRKRYAVNQKRIDLYYGMSAGLDNLFQSGCLEVYLDGSYITTKPHPSDFEICWDPRFVDPRVLDPVFLKFDNGRFEQKQKFLGEFFPTILIESSSGKPFTEYFQKDKDSGKRKGIIRITNYLNPGGLI